MRRSRAHPGQFPACRLASDDNVPEALREMDRAIEKLGAKGIQIFTNMNGRPLDEPEFYPTSSAWRTSTTAVWVQPTRTANSPIHQREQIQVRDLLAVRLAYETSVFMARLVFSGMMEKLPGLKIITHHLGAIGAVLRREDRLRNGSAGHATSDEDYTVILKRMAKRPVDTSGCSTRTPR